MKFYILFLISLLVSSISYSQASDKYLPTRLIDRTNDSEINFSYDSQNRLTVVEKVSETDTSSDSLFYRADNSGFKIKTPEQTRCFVYIENSDSRQVIVPQDEADFDAKLPIDKSLLDNKMTFELDELGNVKSWIPEGNMGKIRFMIDDNGNIQKWEVVGYTDISQYMMVQDVPFLYDNKCGIFKDMARVPLLYLYEKISIPFIQYSNNNVIRIDKENGLYDAELEYEYLNENGYPTLIKHKGDTVAQIEYKKVD